MSISSIPYALQNRSVPRTASAAGTTATDTAIDSPAPAAAGPGAGDAASISPAARALGEAATQGAGAQPHDFTAMTPRQMQGVAKDMFQRGEIDIDQLFQLQFGGIPLGKEGPHGEFLPLTDDERQGFMDRPVDYLRQTSDQIAFLEKTGYAHDPKSGYDMLRGLLATLRSRQSSMAAA